MARKNDLFQRGLIIDSIYFTYNQPYHGTQGLLGGKESNGVRVCNPRLA